MANIPSTRAKNTSRTVYDVLPDGEYPARISRFIGLGVQEQPEWQGQKKDPAFKCQITFELIGVDTTGRKYENDEDKVGKPIDPAPACQFKDYYLFPGAKRGGVFDLCQIIDPSLTAVPRSLDWFVDNLGAIVNVRVGHYVNKMGVKRNKIVAVTPIPTMFKSQIGAARLETVGFDPYEDTPAMFSAYSKLYGFQREILSEAKDVANIPFAGKEPARMDNSNKPAQNQAPSTPPAQNTPFNSGASGEQPFDDEIPF